LADCDSGEGESVAMPLSFARIGRRLIRGSVSSFVVMAIFFLLLEVAGRMVDPLGISYYPETARYLDTMIVEEPIGYRNRPNLQDRFWGKQVSINSLGMRDREVNPLRLAGASSNALLGDSVVLRQRNHSPEGRMRGSGTSYRVSTWVSHHTEQELIRLEI
jgi:hypothetical protein